MSILDTVRALLARAEDPAEASRLAFYLALGAWVIRTDRATGDDRRPL